MILDFELILLIQNIISFILYVKLVFCVSSLFLNYIFFFFNFTKTYIKFMIVPGGQFQVFTQEKFFSKGELK